MDPTVWGSIWVRCLYNSNVALNLRIQAAAHAAAIMMMVMLMIMLFMMVMVFELARMTAMLKLSNSTEWYRVLADTEVRS